MCARLVVGSGPSLRDVVSRLVEEPTAVAVVSRDSRYVETLQEGETDVTAMLADPLDPATYESIDLPVESVVVTGTESAATVDVAATVRSVYPDSYVLAIDSDGSVGLVEYVDAVLDPTEAIASETLQRVDSVGWMVRQLRDLFVECDSLGIVMHDNPDPDAIASGIALERIARRYECDVDVCYFGSISHQENRAFVNLLGIDLEQLDAETDLSVYDTIALVDHSRPGMNDQLPEDTPVDVVIDHHPPRGPVEARYVDLRSDVGATSTLLTDYLRRFDVEIDETVATALLFGIRIDTDEFTREVSPMDFEAAAFLIRYADLGTLERIESPSMSADTLETIADAIHNRKQHGSALLSFVGRLSDRDALAQAADRLLNMEDVTTTLVYGLINGEVYISARARGTSLDLGEALRDAFGQIGSAGGHADMAGAQIELGVMEAIEDNDESLLAVIEDVITDRFLETIESHPQRYSAVFDETKYVLAGDVMEHAFRHEGGEGHAVGPRPDRGRPGGDHADEADDEDA